jgi:hypothetical protein
MYGLGEVIDGEERMESEDSNDDEELRVVLGRSSWLEKFADALLWRENNCVN